MRKHASMSMLFLSLLLVGVLVSACGSSKVGTIPSGTPDLGNGTPAVIPTPKTSPQPVVTAPPSVKGAFYAFVRKNELWVALHGADPVQITHFDYTGLPDVFWHQPVWSSDDRFLAFITSAHPAGLGGGGCPAPDYGANGALYLLNTATRQLTKLLVPADSGDPVAASMHDGYWQYVFWEDAGHLLAWYNGVVGKASSTAGLYRYDVKSGSLTLVLPLSSLGVATLFQARQGLPLMLSMHYSSGQLFYQVVVHAFEQHSQFVIYRHSVAQSSMPGSKVLETGSEPWCAAQQSGAYVKPGWDVSPDGEELVAQMIMANGPTSGVSNIQVMNLKDASTTGLFAQASSQMLSSDLMLSWGPDSQTVVATAYRQLNADGPYSVTLANPTVMQKYVPNLAGQVSWRSDGSAFALSNADVTDMAAGNELYVFAADDTQGRLLLTDAQNFVWG